MSRRVANAIQLGYIGVDIVVDARARPRCSLRPTPDPAWQSRSQTDRVLVSSLEKIDRQIDSRMHSRISYVGRGAATQERVNAAAAEAFQASAPLALTGDGAAYAGQPLPKLLR